MKNPTDQLIQNANDIRLSGEAKERIRAGLIVHMRAHPPIQSPYQRFFSMLSPYASKLRMPVTALSFILVITLGSASTFAADALPGDLFYPFKVSVIEPVKGLLAVTPEAQTEFRISLIETRIHEVERLAMKEELTPEENVKSQVRFDDSLQESERTIANLSLKNPEAAAKIEVSLEESLNKRADDLNQIVGVTASSSIAFEVHSFANHIQSKTARARTAASMTLVGTTSSKSKHGDDTATSFEATTTEASTTAETSRESENSEGSEDSLEEKVRRAFRNFGL